MKCKVRNYVNYFLLLYCMKKISLLFFTFSGIYAGFSQKPAVKSSGDSLNGLVLAETVILATIPAKEKPYVKIFPNPAKNKVELEIKGFEPGFIQLRFIDARGNCVRDDKRILYSGNEQVVVMFSLLPGLYFLQIKQAAKTERRKLLVE